jgi:hypothetical protein
MVDRDGVAAIWRDKLERAVRPVPVVVVGVEGEWRDGHLSQPIARTQDIVECRSEGDVVRESDGCWAERPETEHCLAGSADPEEGCATLGELQCERETDDVTVEGD